MTTWQKNTNTENTETGGEGHQEDTKQTKTETFKRGIWSARAKCEKSERPTNDTSRLHYDTITLDYHTMTAKTRPRELLRAHERHMRGAYMGSRHVARGTPFSKRKRDTSIAQCRAVPAAHRSTCASP